MRVLACAAVAACVASPAVAKVLTLSPLISTTFHGALPDPYDAEADNCAAAQGGEVMQFDHASGTGSIGSMEAYFFADDRRANFEFGLGGIKGKIKTARLRFDAVGQYGDDGEENCLFGYVGDGVATIHDYLPSMTQVGSFFLQQGPDSELWWTAADIDLTGLVAGFRLAGVPFLGLQMVKSTFDDTVIDLDGVRLVIETVPEPATLALFGLGLLGVAVRRRRHYSAAAGNAFRVEPRRERPIDQRL